MRWPDIEQETFVILPHPQVLGYMRKKTENYDRWIAGMAKIQAKMREAYGKTDELCSRHSGVRASTSWATRKLDCRRRARQ